MFAKSISLMSVCGVVALVGCVQKPPAPSPGPAPVPAPGMATSPGCHQHNSTCVVDVKVDSSKPCGFAFTPDELQVKKTFKDFVIVWRLHGPYEFRDGVEVGCEARRHRGRATSMLGDHGAEAHEQGRLGVERARHDDGPLVSLGHGQRGVGSSCYRALRSAGHRQRGLSPPLGLADDVFFQAQLRLDLVGAGLHRRPAELEPDPRVVAAGLLGRPAESRTAASGRGRDQVVGQLGIAKRWIMDLS